MPLHRLPGEEIRGAYEPVAPACAGLDVVPLTAQSLHRLPYGGPADAQGPAQLLTGEIVPALLQSPTHTLLTHVPFLRSTKICILTLRADRVARPCNDADPSRKAGCLHPAACMTRRACKGTTDCHDWFANRSHNDIFFDKESVPPQFEIVNQIYIKGLTSFFFYCIVNQNSLRRGLQICIKKRKCLPGQPF